MRFVDQIDRFLHRRLPLGQHGVCRAQVALDLVQDVQAAVELDGVGGAGGVLAGRREAQPGGKLVPEVKIFEYIE